MINKRRNYFIDKDFQTKFIIKFCLLVVFSCVVMAVTLLIFFQGSTTVAIENTKVNVKGTADFIWPLMVQTIVIVAMFSAASVVILTLLISHKISGPLYRLKKEIDKFGEGNFNVNFNTRAGDQLKELTTALNAMLCSLKEKLAPLKKDFLEIKETIEEMPTAEKDKLKGKIKSIESNINSLKGL